MALVVKDRVKETTTSTGTGTITLGGAADGFQSFSVIGDGNTTYYAIVDSGNQAWEVGIGTYTATGTTLSRDTILESSNAGAAVDFAAGDKSVFCTHPAEKSLFSDSTIDASTLDGIDSSSFLRSDTSDSATGTHTFDDLRADGGNLIIGNDAYSTGTTYVGLKTSFQSGVDDYMIISGTTDGNTYVSAKDGSAVHIRGGGNYSSNEIKVPDVGAPTIGGNTIWHSGNDGSGSGLDADTLDGAQPSVSASNSTIVQRHSSGYIFANYFNTTPNDVTSGVTKVCVETGNDGYIRHGTADAIRSFIGIESANLWIDAATGNYGTVRVDDDRGVTWAGYAMRDDWVLMSDGANNCGIYNDTDNEWALLARRNAEVELYYNGAEQATTASGYFLANNQMRSPIFYDSNNTAYYTNPASTSVMNDIYLEGEIYHNGDTNTYIQFHAADQWRVVTGGAERLEVNNTNTTVANNLICNGTTTGLTRIKSTATASATSVTIAARTSMIVAMSAGDNGTKVYKSAGTGNTVYFITLSLTNTSAISNIFAGAVGTSDTTVGGGSNTGCVVLFSNTGSSTVTLTCGPSDGTFLDRAYL